MRLLLDTHAFLWWIAGDERLSPHATELIADGTNEVFVSAASVWEIDVKSALGRVEIREPIERFLPSQLRDNGFRPLPIELGHVLALAALPDEHRDPFDRILVAQALAEHLILVSAEPLLRRYPVPVEW